MKCHCCGLLTCFCFAGDVAASARGTSAAFSYAHSKGLFIGVSLEASVIASRPDVNRQFYGEFVFLNFTVWYLRCCGVLDRSVLFMEVEEAVNSAFWILFNALLFCTFRSSSFFQLFLIAFYLLSGMEITPTLLLNGVQPRPKAAEPLYKALGECLCRCVEYSHLSLVSLLMWYRECHQFMHANQMLSTCGSCGFLPASCGQYMLWNQNNHFSPFYRRADGSGVQHVICRQPEGTVQVRNILLFVCVLC